VAHFLIYPRCGGQSTIGRMPLGRCQPMRNDPFTNEWPFRGGSPTFASKPSISYQPMAVRTTTGTTISTIDGITMTPTQSPKTTEGIITNKRRASKRVGQRSRSPYHPVAFKKNSIGRSTRLTLVAPFQCLVLTKGYLIILLWRIGLSAPV
jgi:hypothetical protein